uniref:Transmembrane protein n=1 Tax=Medicago truncatula TaxID=3880 RepID=I3SGK7_MEDTR|nr:unknown [Medicago truncatula]
MSTLVQFSIKFSHLKPNDSIYKTQPTFSFSNLDPKFNSFHLGSFKLRACRDRWSFLGGAVFKNGGMCEEKGCKKEKRVVLVKNNQGFGFNNGGGRDDGSTARILGNLALAAGLTYLSMTGQLGWIIDAIVSIWIFAVLVPIVGIGAFLWWAGRDIMKGTCPNCGNDFQVFKSTLNEELQLCPFCGQPFSVDGNEFVKEPVNFSNQFTTFGQAFDNFSSSKNDKDSGKAIDVEAEIKDAD